MKSISSRDNPRYKALKHLTGSSQARHKAGQTILDGVHLCAAYLDAGCRPLCCMVAATAQPHPEVQDILRRLDQTETLLMDDKLFAPLSQVEQGVGIAFLIEVPRLARPTRIEQGAVLLDRIQDPGNLGSILRSAAAAGVRDVYCATGTAAAWSPKVLRAGMGAHFHLALHESCDLGVLLETATFPVWGTSSHATATLYESDLKAASAWLFGNEGQGVEAGLLIRAQCVRIPQPGGMESLNVAAAAAICLFEQVRQRA